MDVKNNTQMVLGRELHDELFNIINVFDNRIHTLNTPEFRYDLKNKLENYVDFKVYWEINEKLERLLW